MKTNKLSLDTIAALIMILASVVALICSNTAANELYESFIQYPLQVGYLDFAISYSIKDWVKEFLMAIFFLNITLELKKEFYEGFLTDRQQFVLPLFATLGGMVVPALCYLGVNYNYPQNTSGFAIPCATDIAFAMCVFNLLSRNLSSSIKIFLLSIAIFDDLGSMLIIAIFYNQKISLVPLLLSGAIMACMFLLHKRNVCRLLSYFILAALLLFFFHECGVHSTMAGVVLGSFVPMYNGRSRVDSPLKTLNKAIHPWVQFLILPLFAFVASGVQFAHLQISDLLNPISLGVICGLFLGKQIGIFFFTLVAVRLKLAPLPEKSNWFEVYFAACLAGIGFTMSLFIGSLAFNNEILQDFVKIGILLSSLITTIYCFVLIRLFR